jgi:two-component system cell cycle response regulator
MSRLIRQPLLAIAGLLLVLVWAHVLLGVGGPGLDDVISRWVYEAIFVLAAVTCLAHAVRSRTRRVAAAMLGAGLLSSVIGTLIYNLAPNLEAVPVPSISDPFWLAVYPCEYVALLVLTRGRVGRTLLATRLDGLLSGLSVAAVIACVSVPAAVDAGAGGSLLEQATNLAYPIGDLALLGAVVSAIALAGWRIDATWGTLAGALVLWVGADLMYLLGAGGMLGNVADALVLTGVTGFAAAIAATPSPTDGTHAADRGLFVPVGFGVLALALLVLAAPAHLNGVAIGLAGAALALVLVRMTLALRENRALLGASRVEATTDPLTGLGNRRKLKLDLARILDAAGAPQPHALVMLDLNGFKTYNDSYGHGAGDLLLAQLGAQLAERMTGQGEAYRLGGDEFCVLAPQPAQLAEFGALCANALAVRGDGFAITAAHGTVVVPEEGEAASDVLALADARMYQDKNSGRRPAAHQSADVLVAMAEERAPALARHMRSVRELACALAAELGLEGDEREALRHAAALHDIGKMAIPEAILEKQGRLSDADWELVRRHPLIGERILAAAPALDRSARIVRWTHERIDGSGYPDGLAGAEIPLAARIILVADAFDAMTTRRPYAPTLTAERALAELTACAGTQFDASVVAALAAVRARGRDRVISSA